MMLDNMTIRIEKPVYQKIIHWVMKSNEEISGLGKVVMENGVFVVKSAVLAKQENTPSHTEMNGTAVAKMMYLLKDEPGHLNFWWHSHADMEVFWSQEDTDTIQQIGNQGWCLAVVFNHRHDYRAAYYQKGTGFIPNVFIDKLTMGIDENINYWEASWDKEFDINIEAKVYTQFGNYLGKSTVLTSESAEEIGDVRKMLEDPNAVKTYEDLTNDDFKYLENDPYQPYL